MNKHIILPPVLQMRRQSKGRQAPFSHRNQIFSSLLTLNLNPLQTHSMVKHKTHYHDQFKLNYDGPYLYKLLYIVSEEVSD